MRRALIFVLLLATHAALAQWQMEDSHSHAGLRGIHSLGNGLAWASGTEGTVLRTVNGGVMWESCSIPPGAEALDFRAVQAFDEKTAIVMSAGGGDLSRLYKTSDGCKSWKLVLTNPDGPAEGFFDALLFITPKIGFVFGDPAHGSTRNPVEGGYFNFRIRATDDGGTTWVPITGPDQRGPGFGLEPLPGEGLFAASNSSAAMRDGVLWIGTGGGRVLRREIYDRNQKDEPDQYGLKSAGCGGAVDPISHRCGIPWANWHSVLTPLAGEGPASGIFSLAFRNSQVGVAVGGDYKKPNERMKTAAYTVNGGLHWTAATKPPGGYRSAVAYDDATKMWIAVGPNGTDVSTDDGRIWVAVKPSASESRDANQNWNALSLPFVVGPEGRIGKWGSSKKKMPSN